MNNEEEVKEDVIDGEEVNKTNEEDKLSNEEDKVSNEEDKVSNEEVEKTDKEVITSDEIILQGEEFSLKDFNTLKTVQGDLKLNEQLFLELKITNLYLNLILLAIVICFLYYVISKSLKKLFYVNIF